MHVRLSLKHLVESLEDDFVFISAQVAIGICNHQSQIQMYHDNYNMKQQIASKYFEEIIALSI